MSYTVGLKGQYHKIFCFWQFASGINDIGGKLASGVNDTTVANNGYNTGLLIYLEVNSTSQGVQTK